MGLFYVVSVMGEMLGLGYQKAMYEDALYFYKNNGELQGLRVTHKDDFLDAGNEKQNENILSKVKQSFIWISSRSLSISG